MNSFLIDVAMRDPGGPAAGLEQLADRLHCCDRAVLAARAPDRERQVALALPDEPGQKEREELVEPAQELLVLGHALEEFHDLAVAARLRLELLLEERVLEEPDVEHE